MNLSQREKIIARLVATVEETKVSFEEAKAEHDRAVARGVELGPSHPDGTVNHATQVYTRALQNYKTALTRYNRFILDGEVPDEFS